MLVFKIKRVGSSPAILVFYLGCSIIGSAFILGVSGIGSSPIIPKFSVVKKVRTSYCECENAGSSPARIVNISLKCSKVTLRLKG